MTFHEFERIVFFTGAGLSAESGIPTYRGRGGIWREYNYEDFARQRAFDRDPEKVWDFHDGRRSRPVRPTMGTPSLPRFSGRSRPRASSRRTSTGCTSARGRTA